VQVKRILAPTLLVLLFGTLLIQLPIAIAHRASDYEWFDPIIEVRTVLLNNFVREPDEKAMQRAMIDGMIASLDDPYTQYVPPADRDEFNKILRGTYAGIGAEVNVIDGYLTIVTPMDDSPALRAGVLAGDIVLEIEGESTFERPIDESIERLTGEVGTDVTMKVRHLDGEEEVLTITRAQIVTKTVRGLRRIGDAWNYCVGADLGLHYLRVTQFNAKTADELVGAIRGFHDDGLNGLILDLRDDPGGAFPIAREIVDLFLDDGTIVSVRGRSGETDVYTARAEGTLPQFPMIVLVNDQSASASEIVAGALQENARAKVLGTRTFGKASVQEVDELDFNAGTLKYTTAHYYLPSGRNLNRMPDSETWGVDPDPGFVVPMSDEQRIAMIRARREFEIIKEPTGEEPECVDAAWIRENMLDEQLAVAVEALQTRLTEGAWPQPSDADSGVVAFDAELKRGIERRRLLMEQLEETQQRIDELRAAARKAGRPPVIPPNVDLEDSVIAIHDREGNLIGEYRVEGGNLRIALEGVLLEPVGQGAPENGRDSGTE
jgi:carboxyl-terminal processing protease